MNIYENPHVLAPHPGGNVSPENKSVKIIFLFIYAYNILSNNMNF